ncbi:hypothetical protein PVK06_028527 [Gossypium arboreum]|uniref:Uncharacterized protein n=1 Tax=Gossypium arboreum TaxID=29729 RepID=A0ABR0P384_GOSAR|nr:hypothetical protein PVK06_028527 [Gossypium arboreum]
MLGDSLERALLYSLREDGWITMEGCMAVNSEGKSSGLALMLKERVKITVQNYSKYHIDSLVSLDDGNELRFTGFYGQANLNLRKESWDMLRRVKRTVKERWITNNREGPDLVNERLDRFLILEDMIEKWPFLTTMVIRQLKSDYEKKNSIEKLKDSQGMCNEDKNDICNIVWSYFHDLFKTSIDPDEEIDLQVVPKCITDSMNNTLDK